MTKRIIVGRALSLSLVLGAFVSYFAWSSCSTEPAEPRQIPSHTLVNKGVSHAEPAVKAERYCARCHGTGLQGGVAGEPSCYSCHGKNWLDESTAYEGPADHTIQNLGYYHKPGLFEPAAHCAECHGAELAGDLSNGLTRPGCTLCHTKLWEERLPSTIY
jgi:hypothetical protein